MTEHSEQAKAAYPDYRGMDAVSEDRLKTLRTAFDRGYKEGIEAGDYHEGFEEGYKAALAERRITDRETLVETIRGCPTEWRTSSSQAHRDSYEVMQGAAEKVADAILALQSTPE